MRKNWIALFAILLVALAPVSFADHGDEAHDETDAEQQAESDAEAARQQAESDAEAARQQAESDAKSEYREQIRDRTRERRADIREKFASRREALRALRGELDQCRGRQTDECKQLRRDATTTSLISLTISFSTIFSGFLDILYTR